MRRGDVSLMRTYLSEVTERVVSRVIHPDSPETDVVVESLELPLAFGENDLPTSKRSKRRRKSPAHPMAEAKVEPARLAELVGEH